MLTLIIELQQGVTMTLKKIPTKPFSLHGLKTARALRELAQRAEKGEILGVAVASWTSSREPELGVVGVFENAPHIAHYAVCRLQAALLHPQED